MRSVILAFIAGMIALHQGQSGAAVLTIAFGTENADLPYSEGGLIFTAISQTGAIRGAPDAVLSTGGTLTPEIRNDRVCARMGLVTAQNGSIRNGRTFSIFG